jgi:hypothetical protein
LGGIPFNLLAWRISVNLYERKNSELIKEFNRYVREHPGFANSIPRNALVVMQLTGDRKFNEWSRKLAKIHASENQPIVYIQIRKLRPLRSRIEKLELRRVA